MTKPAEISAQPVVRDRWGGWTHPDFFSPSDSREFPRPGEFEAWLAEHHLQSATVWMENDVPDWMMDTFWKTGNCSLWQPSEPAGSGWFTGSIHDTDDGAVCIWLRRREEDVAS
ncbi:hypothetical protein B2M27_15395 (plasmid) [Kluyvera intermedia]|uniref:Uncharacterized protein n=1 Tax=Kluyvera intermedia TaxID=61648 RepID=A0ABX3UD13_KLUIN|nr:hypothetical protein [Kluyvera intermedia]ORJ49391.1 hypothetical protein B2M27_15395 [Kluyvera intermedia]